MVQFLGLMNKKCYFEGKKRVGGNSRRPQKTVKNAVLKGNIAPYMWCPNPLKLQF
jgi:hypothetical protein